MQPDNLFKHSGRFSAPGLLLAIFKGAVVGGVLGAIYAVVGYYSPFFVINMIVMVAVGVAIGYFCEQFVRAGDIRNTLVAALAGALTAIAALGIHWLVWLKLMTGTWFFDPNMAILAAKAIAIIGPWSVFDWTPRGGVLYAIWGLEAALILGLATFMARNAVRDTPFCETTGKWADLNVSRKNFAQCDIDQVGQQLQTSPSSILNLLEPPNDGDTDFTRFTLGEVPGSNLRTVTITAVKAKVKDGKIEEDLKTVLNNLVVDASTYEKLVAACG